MRVNRSIGVPGLRNARCQTLGQVVEATAGNLVNEIVAPAKMAIKRSGGNTDELRCIGKSEAAQSALGDKTLCGLDQRLAQVSVMVTALVEGAMPRSHSAIHIPCGA
jgi:hypothetical protein